MLDLPVFFSLDDFEKCSEFIERMISEQSMVERGHGFAQHYFGPEISQKEREKIIAEESEKEGPVNYYFELAKYFEIHEACSLCFREIIAACDGGSSNIAEFTHNEKYRFIAATAHDVGFMYFWTIFASTTHCCQASGEDITKELIEKNLPEIQEWSAKNKFESDEELRLISRIIRERAIVMSYYSTGKQATEISSLDIRKAVSLADGRQEIDWYSPQWLTTKKKEGEWPKEKTGGGRRHHSWDFNELKPFLKKQFPQVDWDSF